VFGGAVVTMASHGADQLMVQRYLCSRSLGEARAALVSSGVVVLAQFLLFLSIGVGLAALTHYGGLDAPAGTKNDEVFGYFIVNQMPAGLIGLVVAAVLAAAMSTLSSSLNSSANAFVSDFFRPLWPHHPEHTYLTLSKVMTSVWGTAQVGVALAAHAVHSQESVINQVMAIASATTGLVLGLFLLGSLRRAVSSKAALAGLVTGFAVVAAVWLPSAKDWLPNAAVAAQGAWQYFGVPQPLAWPWYAPVGAGTTIIVGLLVNGFTHVAGPPANGGPQPGLDEPR
jgi:Na+/proline symporter